MAWQLLVLVSRTPLSYQSYTTTNTLYKEEHIIIKYISRSGKKLNKLIENC